MFGGRLFKSKTFGAGKECHRGCKRKEREHLVGGGEGVQDETFLEATRELKASGEF